MVIKRGMFAVLLCSTAVQAAADCMVRSGLDFLDNKRSTGVVECMGADSESRQNIAIAIARAQLSKLTAANFEHTVVANGAVKRSDHFISGFAGKTSISSTEPVEGGVRYKVEAVLDEELREKMVEGMSRFPGMVHRLNLLEKRLRQMSEAGLGSGSGVNTKIETYSLVDEMESIRGTVISADEIQKRVVEYELIESGTIEYLESLANSIEVRVMESDLVFNSRLDRWEVKQEIRWALAEAVEMPPWLEVVFVGKPGGKAHIAANGSDQIVEIFSKVIEDYAIDLTWENGKKAWSVTHACTPFYRDIKEWGVTTCDRSNNGRYMAVRLRALNNRVVQETDQTARVTAPLASPNDAQNFGRIKASLIKHKG